MNLIPGIRATGNALAAEKVRLSVVAQNIANAHTTRDSDGGVYKRKLVAFEAL
ncbi:MAG: flagellar basal body rod protein FlgC, partial [Opitutae bacterium]|nr:flagellar basal body rod protein FlgC [Opitutae bacterium]